MQAQEVEAGLDEALDALAHRYRRGLLIALADDNPRDATDVQEAAASPGAISDGAVESSRLETELVHTHLPKLAEAEYITWDRETDEIKRGPNWDEIVSFVRLLREHEDELPTWWL